MNQIWLSPVRQRLCELEFVRARARFGSRTLYWLIGSLTIHIGDFSGKTPRLGEISVQGLSVQCSEGRRGSFGIAVPTGVADVARLQGPLRKLVGAGRSSRLGASPGRTVTSPGLAPKRLERPVSNERELQEPKNYDLSADSIIACDCPIAKALRIKWLHHC